ncbi:TPA: hypothetical protein N0F65_004097 [Lagenidium giganteum]|uniref:Uncharacterized protein n=1 Tax=Lagenidium giganteum TaxID=4803 RepID=A0AAV2ZHG4_9STRA|nr:TPA: hypothetical protein N0F65_004097 [Lagenidium giganteum]
MAPARPSASPQAWARVLLDRGPALSVRSLAKMKYANPVVDVVINGEPTQLIITNGTFVLYIDGILTCADLSERSYSSANVDFVYARKLLRLQLSGMIQEYAPSKLELPSLHYSSDVILGVFHLRQQWLSPAAVEYFLKSSNATGFIGVGYAFAPQVSPFWRMIMPFTGYVYTGMGNATAGNRSTALRAAWTNGTSTDSPGLLWSEPLAQVEQDHSGNYQGITFPIHNVHFRCVDGPTSDRTASSRRAEVIKEFSSNWDVVVDYNAPCLVLPLQFYDSLATWLGMTYNDEIKLSELRLPTQNIEYDVANKLPLLYFSLSHQGRMLAIPLKRLILPELSSSLKTTVCIQRSNSIAQNGASIFSPLDSDAGTSQRYRLHGSMALPLYNMIQAPIIFGAMVLDSFAQVGINGYTQQVGFMVTDEVDQNVMELSAADCFAKVSCHGQQIYNERINICVDPDCSVYSFHYLDDRTKRCVLRF